jgi:DivIVA domain-containing protein
MDLTPDLLLEAKFAPARRGYDMNEVDDFLERCAEGLDVLLARLRAEFDRAERAEAALLEHRASGGAAVAAEPTVEVTPEVEAVPVTQPVEPAPVRAEEPMRILIAAERTAEAAIADARAEAERIRAEAESVASTTRSEAETLLARSRAEAEAEARKAGDDARRSIESEVLALRQDRDVLAEDVRSLRSWLDVQRDRLRTTAQDLQRIVDDPEALGEVTAPAVLGDTAGSDDEPSDDAAPVSDDQDDPTVEATSAREEPAAPDLDDDVVDARSGQELRSHTPVFDDGEPTQAVPTIESVAPAGARLFDDERAPSTGAFFGSDAIR